jgi:penicillin-binding protein 1B
MAAKRKKRSTRRAKGKAGKRSTHAWLKIPLALFLLLFVGLAFYIAYLDGRVRRQFEGKRWAVPARVYARPMELYAGLAIAPGRLASHLDALGYRKTSRPDRPGTYRLSGDSLELTTRGFEFWDGSEPAVQVGLRFEQGRVSALRGADGSSPGLVRLDPALVAGIYPSHHEDRVLLRRDEIPDLMVQGLIAVEDRKFYQHGGVDSRAILRALVANLRAGRTVQGGSTLTQQLVKNFFLTPERTLKRKINEALMSLLVEWHYDKDEILEAYANEVYVGQDGQRAIHGFGLASHFYFGRPLGELPTEQLALLVGLVKGPSYYDPRRHPERARERRDVVLALMQQQDVLSRDALERAVRQPLGVSRRTRGGVTAYPAFLDLVRRQLAQDYRDEDLTSEGLKIFTTLDLEVQQSAERGLAGGLPILERRHGLPSQSLQGAAVFTDTQTGELLALVGGRNVREVGFNRALDARRPIGSLAKPFVYLQALSQPDRYHLMSWLDDGPLVIERPSGEPWTPQNYDRQFHGPVPLHEALARSYNVATVRLALDLGIETLARDFQRYGLSERPAAYPSLALGALELAPIEVAGLFQVLSSGGFRTPIRAIREVVAADGRPLQRYALKVESVADPGAVYLTTKALQEVVSHGTGRSLAEKVPAAWRMAGKTGTTDGARDSWFAAYSGNLLGVVWLGRDDNQPAGLSGAGGALRIFGDVVKGLGLLPLEPLSPTDVEWRWIDAENGLTTEASCPTAARVPFSRSTPPLARSRCGSSAVDGESGIESWFKDLFR